MIEDAFKSYKPIHTQLEVHTLLEGILKTKVSAAERKDYGEINAVYFVRMADHNEYVLKIAPNERRSNNLLQEAWAFNKCQSVGVPVPEVVSADTSMSIFPESYLLTRKIPGIPGSEVKFTDEGYIDLMQQLGHYLYLIHSVPVVGFGEIQVQEDQYIGKHKSLWESIAANFDDSWWNDIIEMHELLSEEELASYRKKLMMYKELFDIPTASLTHGDIGPRNIIMDGNKIVGIVDMENLLATDPVRDFHWFGYWIEGSQRLKALQDGYDDKSLFDSNFSLKMKLYQLVYSFPELAYYQSRNMKTSLTYLQRKVREVGQELNSL